MNNDLCQENHTHQSSPDSAERAEAQQRQEPQERMESLAAGQRYVRGLRIPIKCKTCGKIRMLLPCRSRKHKSYCSQECFKGERAVSERFWSGCTRKESGCWEWNRSRNSHNYGRFSVGQKTYSAHRYAMVFLFGSIPDGMFVCHRCDNPCCVSPFHLYIGTRWQNARDMVTRNRHRWKRARRLDIAGENSMFAVLTEAKVLAMRRMYVPHEVGFQLIAKKFGVSKRAAMSAIKGKTWKHI